MYERNRSNNEPFSDRISRTKPPQERDVVLIEIGNDASILNWVKTAILYRNRACLCAGYRWSEGMGPGSRSGNDMVEVAAGSLVVCPFESEFRRRIHFNRRKRIQFSTVIRKLFVVNGSVSLVEFPQPCLYLLVRKCVFRQHPRSYFILLIQCLPFLLSIFNRSGKTRYPK